MDIIGGSYLNKDSPFKTPAFIEIKDLPEGTDGYSVCTAIENSAGVYNIDCMQRVGNTYQIYLLSNGSKSDLCKKGITINNTVIPVYADNPFVTTFRGEPGKKGERKEMIRILIKDLYRSVASEVLEQMLTHKFGLMLNSPIKFACWRNNKRELTNIKNGDRFCFVSADQLKDNPLPREAYCSRFKVRIFHNGQFRGQRECSRCFSPDHTVHTCTRPKCCRVCKNPNHEPGTPECEFYCDEEDILPFGGEDDPFSSLYPCRFTHNHVEYHSSEQCYLYQKSMKVGDTELASRILHSRDAKHAKKLSKQLRCVPDWDESEIAVNLMTNICIDKFRDVPECNEAMRKAHLDGKVLVEAVWKPSSYSIWGTGLTKIQTLHTKKEGWKGGNQLGQVLTRIMHDMFDDWVDSDGEKDGSTQNDEQSQEFELPPSLSNQDYRDASSKDTDDDEEPMEEPIPEPKEEGELLDTDQEQASIDHKIDSFVSDDMKDLTNVKPKHATRQSVSSSKDNRPSVSQAKKRSKSVGGKRTNTSPLVGIAKKSNSDVKPVKPESKVVIAEAKLKHNSKVS